MKIKLHPEASKEVAEAVLWYEGQQPSLGKRFADEVEAAIYRIAAFPKKRPSPFWMRFPRFQFNLRIQI